MDEDEREALVVEEMTIGWIRKPWPVDQALLGNLSDGYELIHQYPRLVLEQNHWHGNYQLQAYQPQTKNYASRVNRSANAWETLVVEV